MKNAYTLFENKLSDEMYSYFMNKRIPEFWKTWNSKFKKILVNKSISMVMSMSVTLVLYYTPLGYIACVSKVSVSVLF